MVILPLALLIIFLILYFQFKRVSSTLLVFSGIFVAWGGGFLMLWLYGPLRPREEWIPISMPPIMDLATFHKAER